MHDCIKLLIQLLLIVSKFQKCACPSEVRSGIYSSGKSFFETWRIKQKFNLDMNIPMKKQLITQSALHGMKLAFQTGFFLCVRVTWQRPLFRVSPNFHVSFYRFSVGKQTNLIYIKNEQSIIHCTNQLFILQVCDISFLKFSENVSLNYWWFIIIFYTDAGNWDLINKEIC